MKFAHMIAGGLAAFVFAADAAAKDSPAARPASSSTLFPGVLDIPVAEGSNVPGDCAFPDSLKNAAELELACVVTTGAATDEDVDVEYIAWLGSNGFRHSADIIGGFSATREANGCEQVLNIFPHGEENQGGIWFALERAPRCATSEAPAAQ